MDKYFDNQHHYVGEKHELAYWNKINPLLNHTEFAVDLNYNILKIGDDKTYFNSLLPIYDGNVPQYGIVLWSGTLADIPEEFQLCDGTNGTPDLRNLFVKSIQNSSINPGKLSNKEVYRKQIDINEMPSHNHSFVITNHEHDYDGHTHPLTKNLVTEYNGEHTHTWKWSELETSTKSSSQGVNILRPISPFNNGEIISPAGSGHGHSLTTNQTSAYNGDGNVTYPSQRVASGKVCGNVGGDIHDVQRNNSLFLNSTYNNEPLFFKLAFIMKMRPW